MNTFLLFLLRLAVDAGFVPVAWAPPVAPHERPLVVGQSTTAAPAMPSNPNGSGFTRTVISADADISNGF